MGVSENEQHWTSKAGQIKTFYSSSFTICVSLSLTHTIVPTEELEGSQMEFAHGQIIAGAGKINKISL